MTLAGQGSDDLRSPARSPSVIPVGRAEALGARGASFARRPNPARDHESDGWHRVPNT